LAGIVGKIVVVAAEEEEIGKVASGKVAGKSVVVTHEITDAVDRMLEVAGEEIDLGQEPKRID